MRLLTPLLCRPMNATATGHWRKRLKGMPADELFELRDAVTAVTALPGWERIVGLIAEGYNEVFRSLMIGPTRDHADYARQTGYCAGLEEAANVVKAINEVADARAERLEHEAAVDQANRQQEDPQ